jgi:hypothetical protein
MMAKTKESKSCKKPKKPIILNAYALPGDDGEKPEL